MRILGPPESHIRAEEAGSGVRGVANVLERGRLDFTEIAVDVGLLDGTEHRVDLETIRLKKRLLAELGGEPAELDEEQWVMCDQVVFDVGIVVVIAEPVAKHGMALEAKESRGATRRVVHVRPGGQAQPVVEQDGLRPSCR